MGCPFGFVGGAEKAGNELGENGFDLSVKNPNKAEEAALREPKEILREMKKLDEESNEILGKIRSII